MLEMALSTQPYKGARDFYPEDKRLQNYIFATWRRVAQQFGYEEYDASIIEPLELYQAKTSDEIVSEQTYFFVDRGGRYVVLRPEMTPTVSRMVAGRRQELAYPVRWYSIPNVWRYERPQKGRLREHWQLNVDLFGLEGLEADFEIISLADHIMRAFHAKSDTYSIRINSRKLMQTIMEGYLGMDHVQSATLIRLIDRMNKMDHAQFAADLDALFSPSQREEGKSDLMLELLKVRSIDNLPINLDKHESVLELRKLFAMLEHAGITNYVFDMTLMRGFDYYTDIVFEVFDTDPENNRSMFGGGRYDGLVAMFGVEPVPTVGFGMGDVTLANFLVSHGLLPKLHTETQVYVILLGDVYERSQKAIEYLRAAGVKAAVSPVGRKIDKEIRTALKKGIPYVLFIGEKELGEEIFTLRNLRANKEERHGLDRVISIVKDYRHPV